MNVPPPLQKYPHEIYRLSPTPYNVITVDKWTSICGGTEAGEER